MSERTRIVVTGATGFLGGTLCRALKSAGCNPLAIGRDMSRLALLKREGIETLSADLADCDPAHLTGQISRPAAIVHAAALSSPWGRASEFRRANVDATRNIISAAALAGAERFVLISSPTVYFRFQDQFALGECAPLPAPVNAYAATKREAETTVASSGFAHRIILRPRGLYGKGDTALLPRLIRAARSGPLPLVREGIAQTDITHVDDVVSAIMATLLADLPMGTHVFNISGGEPLAMRYIISQACRMQNIEPHWRRVPALVLINAARLLEKAHALMPGYPEPKITAYSAGILAYSQTLDISAAARVLGWQPRVSFEDGLRRTFAGAP